MALTFAIAFSVGFLSTLHCLTMCSGIIGALNIGLPRVIRRKPLQSGLFLVAYNSGRIASYTLAGALVGALSNRLFMALHLDVLPVDLNWLSAGFMMLIGLYIAGLFPRLARVEKLGLPLWRQLEPLGRKLLPVERIPRAFLFGTIWGWLPCGMVYTMLSFSATTGQSFDSALIMLSFGLGTLPVVFLAGYLANAVTPYFTRPAFKRSAGLAIVILAALTALYAQSPYVSVPEFASSGG